MEGAPNPLLVLSLFTGGDKVEDNVAPSCSLDKGILPRFTALLPPVRAEGFCLLTWYSSNQMSFYKQLNVIFFPLNTEKKSW